ncbi:MAG: apolipoprotein N-acyltransferase [Gammaproteobacteria bacterium]|nr:apolipoprotein N-acyltransferase [Gammaproteobacteria bacterium]MBT4607015.1 apolipoprotein N-acyltransferase [Thiotrichales bacterium]MBT3472661.1 apolipoprotein N-acyltransferase [Gammaproteobacteria bacterium]MBT3967138.1 apolipoprotein N-acyltransferase [Gammaproteobacteria bacterium]MBT4080558.1 apolipoprotein N-acyltransferase [Gammaproteobacteria bacterium]
MSSGLRYLLLLLAGGALPLAFAPFEQVWIAPLSVAVLFWFWSQAASHQLAARGGWFFGVGLFGVGASWIQVSIIQFGGMNLPLSLLMTALFVAGMALFFALQGGLLFALRKRLPDSKMVLFPLLWVGFEWLRSWLFGGFPWLLLGHTAPGTFYQGLAPWLGTFGVSLFIAWIALLLLRGVVEPKRRLVLSGQLLLLLGIAWGSSQQQWSEPHGEPLSVALVQGNIAQDQKWRPENLSSTLQRYRSVTTQSEARLVIWPETAIPAFRQQVDRLFLQPLSQQLKEEGRSLISGIPLLELESEEGESNRYYNGVLTLGLDQERNPVAYRKRHLVPMGEYLPFSDLLDPLFDFLQIPFSSFSAGSAEQSPILVAGHQLSPTVCYEIAFPELAFSHLPEAGVLVTVSNDGWFGGSLAPDQHLQIARMRALEAARPVLRATNTGVTAVIGADGVIQQQLPRSEYAVLEVVVQPVRGVTPYLYWSSMAFL